MTKTTKVLVLVLLVVPIINMGLQSSYFLQILHGSLLREDSVSHKETEFAPLREKLRELKISRLSYRVDPGSFWEERVGDYYEAQYLLAPVVLRPHTDEDPWVLMDYSKVGKRFPAPDLECIQDFGLGLAVYRKGHESNALDAGKTLHEREGVWSGTWIRRGNTPTFDATWRNADGGEVQDEVTLESVSCHDVVLFRKGTNGRYRGRLSLDGTRIEGGRADWFAPQDAWSAIISR